MLHVRTLEASINFSASRSEIFPWKRFALVNLHTDTQTRKVGRRTPSWRPTLVSPLWKKIQQECIPVGCVPSAALAVWWGGGCPGGCVCLPSGGVWPEGCLPRGDCLPRGCLPRGVSAYGDGVCLGGIPPPLWTEFLTHVCESITFRNFVCGR